MSTAFGLSPIFRLMALTWWKWARNSLTARDPMHPDLGLIVLRIRELEAP